MEAPASTKNCREEIASVRYSNYMSCCVGREAILFPPVGRSVSRVERTGGIAAFSFVTNFLWYQQMEGGVGGGLVVQVP